MRHFHLFVCVLALLLAAPRPCLGIESKYTADQRLWALGTCAILVERNQGSHAILGGFIRDVATFNTTKASIHEWWGVDSKADLLKVLKDLDEGGGYRRSFDAIAAMTSDQIKAKSIQYKDDPKWLHRVAVVGQYAPIVKTKSITAFDYCRYSYLCGEGYILGYLTQEEAFDGMMLAGRKLQAAFESWEDMAENYLIGRQFWSAEQCEKDGDTFASAVNWLKSAPESPWKTYPWKLDLSVTGK